MNLPPDWEDPQWHVRDKIHNWRNYASIDLIHEWESFTDYQKQIIASSLNDAACAEEWE